jgi:hypothetical protein
MATVEQRGISIDQITAKVLDEGIGLFTDAMDKVLNAIAAKRASVGVSGRAAADAV